MAVSNMGINSLGPRIQICIITSLLRNLLALKKIKIKKKKKEKKLATVRYNPHPWVHY